MLLYNKCNFLNRNIFYYLDFLINKIQRLLILLNIFSLNYIIIFDDFFKIISIKKFDNCLK